METVIDHWDEILLAFSMLIGGFAIIAKLTPWGWDDKIAKVGAKVLRRARGQGK